MLPLLQRCTSPEHEEATLPLSLLPLLWPSPLQLQLPSPSLLLTPSPLPLPPPIAIAVGHLPLRLPPTVAANVSAALSSAVAIAITLAIGHCHLRHRWPLQLPSLLGITVALTVGHFRELLPWHGENCIRQIEAKNAYLILFCLDSGWCTDQSRMTDQVLSGNGQHQRWSASGKQQAASGGSGRQQGGSRVKMLIDHGRCYFVVLLGYQPLADGICDDVLDVVEDIAGETVIELTQEEKGIKEIYD